MKRHGNLWPKITDIENIRFAFEKAAKGKNHYAEVKLIKENPEPYLLEIQRLLLTKTFTTSEYSFKQKIEGGKLRDISSLPFFPDRIVQHALMAVCEPIFRNALIRHTYQSITGRGTSDARKQVERSVRNYKITHFLQMDVKKFYPSIDHVVLKNAIRRRIKCKDTLWLLDNIIDSHPGLPIGNYTSQMLGNLYLNAFDRYVKERLKVKHYHRYCDDIVFMGTHKRMRHLRSVIIVAMRYLNLEIKPNHVIGCLVNNGLDFCGFLFKKFGTRLRKKIKANYLKSLKQGKEKSLNSYKGWIFQLKNRGLWYGKRFTKGRMYVGWHSKHAHVRRLRKLAFYYKVGYENDDKRFIEILDMVSMCYKQQWENRKMVIRIKKSLR